MAESSMITTSAWVPRGFAAPFPSRYNFDETEFKRIAELAKLQLDDANDDLEEARAGGDHAEGDDTTEDDDKVMIEDTKDGDIAGVKEHKTEECVFHAGCRPRRDTDLPIGLTLTMTISKNTTLSTTMTMRKMSTASAWICLAT